ncbi:hypothetical protein K7432_005722 [Basidiobolus ranarum]|uniref:Uncharacterized protein n=1 Tax=Basidiobolus ranarum TaxID=34480 RepID=A0ABR2WW50_9FUNG
MTPDSKVKMGSVDVEETKGHVDAKEEQPLDTSKEVKVAFWKLFRFATVFDCVLMAIGTFCAIVAGTGIPVSTIVYGDLVDVFGDNVTTDPEYIKSQINQGALYFVYIAIGVLATTYGSMGTWIWAGERQTRFIREKYLAAVLRQDIPWFDTLGAGEVTTRITSDTHLIRDGITEKIPQTIFYVSTFVSAFVVAFTKNWRLTLVFCCILPLMVITVGVLNYFSTKFTTRTLDSYSTAGTLAEEVFSSIRTAVAFGQQKKLAHMYSVSIAAAKKEAMKKTVITGAGVAFSLSIVFAGYALAFWYGGKLIIQGELKLGGVITVLFAILSGAFSLGNVGPNLQAFSMALGAAHKLYEVINRVPAIDSYSTEGIKPSEKPRGLIELSHVSFHYPARPDICVLQDISFSVEPGKTVALVGSSGSGKSTIIQLLERFYNPVQGEILLDGIPISNYNICWLRRQIGLVSQEPTLFKCTIAENVAHGLVGTPFENYGEKEKMELIIEACKMANAHNFITALPDQYNTMVGERGFLLSGGQKQRVAIARAIIKNPSILLLDEATSALDTQSEVVVQEALERASAGRTTIVIAHRLSTIYNADNIIVMDKGNVVEVGTHNSLIEARGVYCKLVELQNVSEEEKVENADKVVDELTEIARFATRESSSSTITKLDIETGDGQAYSFWYVIYRVFRINAPEIPLMLGGLLGAIMAGAVNPIFAFAISKIMNDILTRENMDSNQLSEQINFWALMIVIIAVINLFAQMAQISFFGLSSEKLTERIRNLTFSNILHQEIGWFDRDENNVGALVSALSTDATHVQGLSGSTLGIILQVLATFFVGLVIALIYGWKLTLVVMVSYPLLIGAGIVEMKLMINYQDDTKLIYEQSAQLACEATGSIRTVASLTREQDISNIYHSELEKPIKACKKNAIVMSISFAASQAVILLVDALAFWYGGKLFANREYTAEQFFIVYMAVVISAQGAGMAFAFIPSLGKAKSAAASILSMIDRKSLVDTRKKEKDTVGEIEGYVRLKDVHFSYPTRPGISVLKGLSLKVKPGQFIALVGPSGCGKSTIVGLIERFYDVSSGSIQIDGKEIRHMNINSIRRNIALVGQDVALYDMTVGENIAFGLVNQIASQTEIEEAAKNANIHDFIESLPQGYNTPLGNKGSQLSGGQRQRIAIARALIRDPKILLLDEATSALDAESESVVQAALDNATKGRTTIAVSHRLSTIQKADIIYVVNNGVIAERGTHTELMLSKGQYYCLVKKQNVVSP